MQLRSLLIRLHLAHGIGYAGMVRVLQHCRQVQTVVTDPRRLGKLAHLTASQQGRFTADWQSMAFQQRLKRHAQLDILTILDDDYPPALLEAYQPPLVLFLRGQRAVTNDTSTCGCWCSAGHIVCGAGHDTIIGTVSNGKVDHCQWTSEGSR